MSAGTVGARRLDDLVEQIANRRPSGRRAHHRGHLIERIVPQVLVHYVVTNKVPSILSQGGHQLVVHTVVTWGPGVGYPGYRVDVEFQAHIQGSD
jgi:hypothetical protein